MLTKCLVTAFCIVIHPSYFMHSPVYELKKDEMLLTDLRDIGRGWEGESNTVDVEGDNRHAADAAAVDHGLHRYSDITNGHVWAKYNTIQIPLWAMNSVMDIADISSYTYISILTCRSSNPRVHVADVTSWSHKERSACVNNSLAATGASHNLTIDGNTAKEIVNVRNHKVELVKAIRLASCVPVHANLPVGLGTERNPVEGSAVVGAVDLTKQNHAACLCTAEIRGTTAK